jgi:anti-sigma factor RsiW
MTADERRTGPPTGHADLDTLADLHAGVLDGPEADRVREHVADCRQCAATLEALDAVQGQLRSLPEPAMPAVVAARLDAALADLRTERPVPAGGSTAADPEDELARARARRGHRLSRAIGAAAAAVVLLAAGGAIVSIVRGGGTS